MGIRGYDSIADIYGKTWYYFELWAAVTEVEGSKTIFLVVERGIRLWRSVVPRIQQLEPLLPR